LDDAFGSVSANSKLVDSTELVVAQIDALKCRVDFQHFGKDLGAFSSKLVPGNIDALQCSVDLEHLAQGAQASHLAIVADEVASKTERFGHRVGADQAGNDDSRCNIEALVGEVNGLSRHIPLQLLDWQRMAININALQGLVDLEGLSNLDDARHVLAEVCEIVLAQIDALQCRVDLEHLAQAIQASHLSIFAYVIASKTERVELDCQGHQLS